MVQIWQSYHKKVLSPDLSGTWCKRTRAHKPVLKMVQPPGECSAISVYALSDNGKES